MDVEKLFEDIGKDLKPFDGMRQAVFQIFSDLASQGWPETAALSMVQDCVANTGIRMDSTMCTLFEMWKAERSKV